MSGSNNFNAAGVTVNAGTLTLSGSNTYTGGTTVSAATLNINNNSAIGSGALVIGANTILDNTSATPVVLGTNPQNWNGAFTFTGTNSLNLGTGTVTLGKQSHRHGKWQYADCRRNDRRGRV